MKKVSLPAELRLERIIGFTIPRSGAFYVSDHDEVWKIIIAPRVSAEATDHAPYKFVEDNDDFLGLVFEGLKENRPILKVGASEISYSFDPKADFVTVKYKTAGQAGSVDFPTFSGDWFAASLSDDGAHLVLADPYEMAVYQLDSEH